MDDITQLITNMGFPIAMCVTLMWYVNKLNEEHKEEVDKLSEAVTTLKTAIDSLTTFIETQFSE